MARIERCSGGRVLVAESDDERELLAHGRSRDGRLVLLEAYYPVAGDTVALPEGIGAAAARRLCAALERAASSHQEAKRRRDHFQVIEPS